MLIRAGDCACDCDYHCVDTTIELGERKRKNKGFQPEPISANHGIFYSTLMTTTMTMTMTIAMAIE